MRLSSNVVGRRAGVPSRFGGGGRGLGRWPLCAGRGRGRELADQVVHAESKFGIPATPPGAAIRNPKPLPPSAFILASSAASVAPSDFLLARTLIADRYIYRVSAIRLCTRRRPTIARPRLLPAWRTAANPQSVPNPQSPSAASAASAAKILRTVLFFSYAFGFAPFRAFLWPTPCPR
jgi:hypothetical protein